VKRLQEIEMLRDKKNKSATVSALRLLVSGKLDETLSSMLLLSK